MAKRKRDQLAEAAKRLEAPKPTQIEAETPVENTSMDIDESPSSPVPVPEPEPATSESTSQELITTSKSEAKLTKFTFSTLDARLVQAIGQLKFSKPTPVQAAAVPLALEGKDILARAKTGSGKTAAYLIPVIQRILERKDVGSEGAEGTSALILVPTRELADQVSKAIEKFVVYSAKSVRTVNIAQNVSDLVQQSLLSDTPDIVVSTPSRAATHINTGFLKISTLQSLVIDEADLVLSYGYDDDLTQLSKNIPKGVQTFLMSATLTPEVDSLKGLFCRDPILLQLDGDGDGSSKEGGVSQFAVTCAEDEKFLLIYVIYKLKLIKGKSIIFVAEIDRCYRLKLYLEQFAIRSCVLNSELPVNSRLHIVEEFNKNVYDIIIATDENEIAGDEDDDDQNIKTLDGAGGEIILKKKKKTKKAPRRDKEYGVSRGIDFQNVTCVINFDLPTSSKSYTHRIGRTARAGKSGMALSFVIPTTLYGKHRPTSIPSAANDEKVLEKIKRRQGKLGYEVKPYLFDMKQVDAFRYRMDDALRAVTKVAIQAARTKELRHELIASEKLKRHFEENPGDLQHLRHDGELRSARTQPHLKHVPEYLLPKGGNAGIVGNQAVVGFVGLKRDGQNRIKRARQINKMKSRRGGKRMDPLKNFAGVKKK